MSPFSQLKECFPQHNQTTLEMALDAASDDVERAINYLLNDQGNSAVLGGDGTNLGGKPLSISTQPCKIAENSLSNPAFRQPLKFQFATDTEVKEEASTSLNIKSEPLEFEILDRLLPSSTQTKVNPPTIVDKTARKAQEVIPDSDKIIPTTVETPLDTLRTLFPCADQDECRRALQICDQNIERAFELLEFQHLKELISDTSQDDSTITHENNIVKPTQTGLSFDTSLSREEELQIARAQKKRAVSELEVPDFSILRKRKRNELAPKLETATEWVRKFYSSHKTGVAVHLGNKVHRCKFPRPFIETTLPKLRIIDNKDSLRVELGSDLEDLFELAIQWSVCKNIEIDTLHYQTRSKQFDLIMSLVLFAKKYGLRGLGSDMVNHLKPLLIKQRSVLKPSHIRDVQTLVSPHPIQELFVQAAVKPYLEFRIDPNHREMTASFSSSSSDDDSYRDEAHRIAFAGNHFMYEKELKTCPAFELELMRLAGKLWWKREVTKKSGGRGGMGIRTFVIDPLNGEQILL